MKNLARLLVLAVAILVIGSEIASGAIEGGGWNPPPPLQETGSVLRCPGGQKPKCARCWGNDCEWVCAGDYVCEYSPYCRTDPFAGCRT